MIPSMIEFALRALLVAAAVWAGLRLLGVRDVLAQKAAWGLVLASAILMPFALPLALRWQLLPPGMGVVLPSKLFGRHAAAIERPATVVRNIDPVPAVQPAHRAVPAVPAERRQTLRLSPLVLSSSAPATRSTIETAPPIDRHRVPASPAITLPDLESLAISVYLAVCAALLLRIVFGLTSTVSLWVDAEPIEIRGFHPAAGLRLRSSRAISSPVTIGSGIVLPSGYGEWGSEKLRIVLAHERSHVRQGDFYLQLLAGVYAALFWFSPLGWWLKQKLSDLGEAISDRAGLEEAASRSSYAKILLEFAALPRPASIGVAMARSSSLSHRIDRLLNDTAFRQAFAISRRRAIAAALLVPAAFFAATAFIRVEAASQTAPAAQPRAAAALITGQSNPDQAVEPVSPAVATEQNPSAPPAPAAPVVPGGTAVPLAAASTPEPPEPPDADDDNITVGAGQTLTITRSDPDHNYSQVLRQAQVAMEQAKARIGDRDGYSRELQRADAALKRANARLDRDGDSSQALRQARAALQRAEASMSSPPDSARALRQAEIALQDAKRSFGRSSTGTGDGYSYSFSSDGESYALVTDPSKGVRFSGEWFEGSREELEKAGKIAHGKFLWFTRDGKSYVVDDPAIVAGIEAMYKPMEELGRRQEELGKQQEDLGKQQEELGRKQEKASAPAPDVSREIARIEESLAKLKAKQGSNVTQDEISDLQSEIGDLQGRLGEIEGKIGEQQGKLGEEQGRLGEQQGRLGEQQGRLGEEEGRLAREADRKVKSIIDQSLTNGKARPVE